MNYAGVIIEESLKNKNRADVPGETSAILVSRSNTGVSVHAPEGTYILVERVNKHFNL